MYQSYNLKKELNVYTDPYINLKKPRKSQKYRNIRGTLRI